MTVVLGGGISGLSAAHYALQNPNLGKIVLLEASNRLGGWIRSHVLPDGVVFEHGPRTLRCQGPAAKNALNLIDYLKLNKEVVAINRQHPAASQRLIYTEKQLHPLPNSIRHLFKTCAPLKRPLLNIIWRDMTAAKVKKEDESIYSFVERRMGKDVADYIISPIACGIYAGDAHKLSVKAFMPKLFEVEQAYGSMIKGLIMDKLTNSKARKEYVDRKMSEETSELAQMSITDRWSVWGIKDGLEKLPNALADSLRSRGVDIQMKNKCERLSFKEDHVEILVNGQTRKSSRVISSLPAKHLARLVKDQHPELAGELEAIPTVTVAVVNLQFPKDVLTRQAFGFLVPPEEGLPILGVIFDSCIFPQSDSTVLTVMMGGVWYEKYFATNPSNEQLVTVAVENTRKILNIKEIPKAYSAVVLKDCIPQYNVGHAHRVDRIHKYIDAHGLPLVLCGSSYKGVGVNDVILSSKEAVSNIV